MTFGACNRPDSKLDADNVDPMVARLDPNGTLIDTFGDGGHVLVDLGGPGDGFFGISVADDEASATVAGIKGADPDADDDHDDDALARITL